MVTPETGSLTFHGVNSGRDYVVSFYSSDVIGALVTMTQVGVAGTGSLTFWNAPERVILKGASIITGQTVSTVGRVQVNFVDAGAQIVWANIVNTLATRDFPNLALENGSTLTIVQA